MVEGYRDDLASNQTRGYHFTEPVDVESTTFNTQRYIHRIPVNWLTATDPSYNLDTYEFYLENRDLFPDAVERHRVKSVEFEYDQDPVPDSTGKPFRVNLVVTADEDGGALDADVAPVHAHILAGGVRGIRNPFLRVSSHLRPLEQFGSFDGGSGTAPPSDTPFRASRSTFETAVTPETLRRSLLAVILSVTAGCDNVAWGGVQVALETPPVPVRETPPAEDSVTGPREVRTLTSAPMLMVGRRTRDGARLTPIAFLEADSLVPLPAPDDDELRQQLEARFEPGFEAVLFADGVRVGTFIGEQAVGGGDVCAAEFHLDGVAELRRDFPNGSRLLAMERSAIGEVTPPAPYDPPEGNRKRRESTLDMASGVITREGAIWPSSLLEARRDVQMLSLEDGRVGMAGTFLYRDQLTVTPAPDPAYSIFVLGEETVAAFRPLYEDFHRVASNGKAAPRFFQQLDWDRDGDLEFVLEVVGADARWYRVLENTGDGLESVMDTRCRPEGE